MTKSTQDKREEEDLIDELVRGHVRSEPRSLSHERAILGAYEVLKAALTSRSDDHYHLARVAVSALAHKYLSPLSVRVRGGAKKK